MDSKYLINEKILTKQNKNYESELAAAYDNKHRPACICMTPSVEMYIAKIGSLHYIKRMPFTGHLHHPQCESYELSPNLHGRGDVCDRAIVEDIDSGATKLTLDFTLLKVSSNRSMVAGSPKERKTVQADGPKLTLRALLHYLYEEAGLNRWSPKMLNKRNWFVIRKNLKLAAENKLIKATALQDSLFLPETFNLDHKDEINERNRHFFNKFKKHDTKQPLSIIIGELKSIEAALYGHRLIIKHLPDYPLYLAEDIYRRAMRVFGLELSLLEEGFAGHLLVIGTVFTTMADHLQVDTLSIILVDENWLPFEDLDEMGMIARLVAEERSFVKGLRYNRDSQSQIASALLIDTKPPTPIFAVTESGHETISVDGCKEEGAATCLIWDASCNKDFILPKKHDNRETS